MSKRNTILFVLLGDSPGSLEVHVRVTGGNHVLKPSLQTAVDRYATSLAVPSMLESLHPRRQGNPGNAGALAPAIVLTSISAYEGFVEEFLASVAAHRGHNFAQIAKLVTMNNPTVQTFDDKLRTLLNWGEAQDWKANFSVKVWNPPGLEDSTWIGKKTLSWGELQRAADGWMQVRHCLTHGLARGFRSETWPGPLRGTVQAVSVLRPQANGKHSLSIHGAESCAHIFRSAAEALANEAALSIGHKKLNWSKVDDFDL